MKTTDLHLHRDQLHDQLLPLLVGRVFHVTHLSRLEQILASGEIRSNLDGQFPATFGSGNSFFRKRGYVSVFDYRSASPEQIDASILKCSPFHVPFSEHKLVYLFLSTVDHDRLIPWTMWKEEQAWSDKIVPYVEAGYPGSIPITSIEEVLRVIIDYPADPLVEALEKGRANVAMQPTRFAVKPLRVPSVRKKRSPRRG
jgi:hypothetical protein